MTRPRMITGLEFLSFLILLIIAGLVVFVHLQNDALYDRDQQRRTSLNAIYQNLETLYYPSKKSYPQFVNVDSLPAIQPDDLKDPAGILIGQTGSDLRYEPSSCESGACAHYVLRAKLENAAPYVLKSRN